MSKFKIESLTLELLGLVEIEEVWLALAFRIDGNECAGERLEKDPHRLNHGRDWDLLDGFCLLLVEFDVVEGDQVIGSHYEVKIIRNDKAHSLYTCGLRELESHFFRLSLLQEKECHFNGADLHCETGARRMHCCGHQIGAKQNNNDTTIRIDLDQETIHLDYHNTFRSTY